MKKVLIICDIFAPAFAPRMGYLCKNLQKSEWNTTVLTEEINDEYNFSFLNEHSSDVKYFRYYKSNSTLEWALKQILDFLFGYKNRKMYAFYKKELKNEKFDLVLSSSYMTFPMGVANKIAKELKIPLVVDLRDIIEQYPDIEFIKNKKYKFLNRYLAKIVIKKRLWGRNNILRKCSYITTVSEWHVETLKLYNTKTELIFNGFDSDLFYPQKKITDKFIITYTGRLHSLEMQNPSLLFESLHLCLQKNIISPDNCVVKWYVDENSKNIIKKLSNHYQVDCLMQYHSFVQADMIPKILNESSVILVLTNNSNETSGPKGLMTTKFFEALAVEKPILCVRSDESYLEEIIIKAKAGVAARNELEVTNFLLTHFEKWKKDGYTEMNVEKEIVNLFSRQKQAKQFIDIFEKAIKEQ